MATLGEALTVWKAAVGSDPTLADDLERVRAADRPPGDPELRVEVLGPTKT